jgi:hypothetical protein
LDQVKLVEQTTTPPAWQPASSKTKRADTQYFAVICTFGPNTIGWKDEGQCEWARKANMRILASG